MLAALTYWGFEVQGFAVGIAAPVLAAVAWGLFVSPRARLAVADLPRLLVELSLFAAAVAALVDAGHATLALILGIAYALDRSLLVAQNRSLAIEQ
jgi:hypothetical protein